LVEPCEEFLGKDKALVAKTLVQDSETVPVRLMNVTDDVKIVPAGTVVGKLSKANIIEGQNKSDQDNIMSRELENLLDRTSKNLSRNQKGEVRKLLKEFRNLFAVSDNDLGHTNVVKHKIDTGDSRPIKQPPRRTPVALREEVEKHIDNMLERNVIEPCDGPWSSGIVLVKKKDGSTRFCVDYRQLNACTLKDAYPLPRIDDSLEQLSGNKWFTTLDLCSGYWQVEVDEQDRPKTAFATKRGLFQFRSMPFGLVNAPATFERLMENVLHGLQWDICLVYLDDIIVMAKDFEGMIENLRQVFGRLQDAGLKLNRKSVVCLRKMYIS